MGIACIFGNQNRFAVLGFFRTPLQLRFGIVLNIDKQRQRIAHHQLDTFLRFRIGRGQFVYDQAVGFFVLFFRRFDTHHAELLLRTRFQFDHRRAGNDGIGRFENLSAVFVLRPTEYAYLSRQRLCTFISQSKNARPLFGGQGQRRRIDLQTGGMAL